MNATEFKALADQHLEVETRTAWLGDRPCVKVTLRNPSDEAVQGWSLMVTAPGKLAGIVDARCFAFAASVFHIKGEGRSAVVPPHGTVSFGMLFE